MTSKNFLTVWPRQGQREAPVDGGQGTYRVNEIELCPLFLSSTKMDDERSSCTEMILMAGHRKRIRHDLEPGDLHELTFSCDRRMPLLTNDHWRKLLCQSIDRAVGRWNDRLVAFVLMPEHPHLLVLPVTKVDVDSFLSAVKRPHSVRIKR